jgi:hypothetical protein
MRGLFLENIVCGLASAAFIIIYEDFGSQDIYELHGSSPGRNLWQETRWKSGIITGRFVPENAKTILL